VQDFSVGPSAADCMAKGRIGVDLSLDDSLARPAGSKRLKSARKRPVGTERVAKTGNWQANRPGNLTFDAPGAGKRFSPFASLLPLAKSK
jgi:hypothetical protein